MKRCPECRRDYYDDTLLYCLDDGNPLLEGPRSEPGAIATGFPSDEEPRTAILPGSDLFDSEGVTRPQITGAAEAPQENRSEQSERQSLSADRAAEQRGRSVGWRWPLAVVGIIAVAALGVFFGIRYFKADSSGAINSIAVLPFENRGGDADSEYLSDGLTESLTYRLSKLPNLKVSPTSSIFRYRGRDTEVTKVGNELGVNAVVTGRVMERGDNLSISIELVDVRSDKVIWGEQYERKMSDLLQTQREIAAEITNRLQIKLSGEDEKTLAKNYTANNEAYQLYLKGRYHWGKRTKDDFLKGIECFQQAIKLDPNFALAYVGVADSYNVMPSYGFLAPGEAFPQARSMAQKAVEIDPTLAQAYASLACPSAYYERDWQKADSEFGRAVELDPNDPQIHYVFGYYLEQTGRIDEGMGEFKKTLELDPLFVPAAANLAGAYLNARQYDLALEQAKRTYKLEPSHPTSRFWLGVSYLANGMNAEAAELGEGVLKTDPTNQDALYITGYAYAKLGRRSEAEDILKRFSDIAQKGYVLRSSIAGIYGALGNKDKAFAELERAFADHDSELPRIKVDPLMDPFRGDPRFAALVKRLNLPE
ncbi:MAG: serine/threonine protein kinase [Acidobacteria bacterium OLB17]|nr:MAG: serine/threonine protein kinase [Acidobacteria bacterium OLB17]MCZ2391225.1 tetratricopeptide repeat protein [Acidobacteriota bacterium]